MDRRVLPAPDRHRQEETTFVAPRNELEHQLAQIWSEILKIDSIGIGDNFFELGGHSLLATQVISRIQTVYALHFPLRYIFEYPTIEQFGNRLGELIHDRSDIEYEQGKI